MRYTYDITPRAPELGGGWKLQLLEDEVEVGGGAFPVDESDQAAGEQWFNECSDEERRHWLLLAASAKPADAWRAFLLAEAHADAENTACDWLDSRSPS